MERFWSDVGAIGPDDRSAVDEKTAEIIEVLEGCEDWSFKPAAEVERGSRPVIERDLDPIPASVLGVDDLRQEDHGGTLLEGFNGLKGFALLHPLPVPLKFVTVQSGPPFDAAPRCGRA